jgi:hypothetical protein
MIRIALQSARESSPAWHTGFLALLPAITRQASIAFRRLKAEAHQDVRVDIAKIGITGVGYDDRLIHGTVTHGRSVPPKGPVVRASKAYNLARAAISVRV